jgi:acyl-CoA dehydrogenase
MFVDELLGPYAAIEGDSFGSVENGLWTARVLAAREFTIAGGTSEIQHNIVAERVLGLPKG